MNDVFEGLDTSSKIKGVLASRSKTQAELAMLLRLTPETITARMKQNKWEVEELKTIAAEFNLTINDLV
jgi:DNA-binding XRE family transcriptional regulator